MATALQFRDDGDTQYDEVNLSRPLPVTSAPYYYTPLALDQITVDATVGGVPLTFANVSGATRVLISVETAPIRYTTTARTVVTASVGLLANIGDQIVLLGAEAQSFKAIRSSGVSALITVEYSS